MRASASASASLSLSLALSLSRARTGTTTVLKSGLDSAVRAAASLARLDHVVQSNLRATRWLCYIILYYIVRCIVLYTL